MLAGIDLGGTTIVGGVAGDDGELLSHETVPTESHLGPVGVLDRVATLIERLAEPYGGRIDALGIGVPGLVDIASGVTRFLPNLPTQWRDIPVAAPLAKRLDCPVRLLNDARAAALAELRFGHGRECPRATFAFFTLGTGVGGGIVIDGQLRLGPLGAAGEIGHQTILPDGPLCGCGNRGCLETLASGTAIAAEGVRLMRMGMAPALREMIGGDSNLVTPQQMGLAACHDPAIRQAIGRAARSLGIAAANLVAAIHPELIVLGGGVSELGDLLTLPVRQEITERVGMFPTNDVKVVRSQLGTTAGLMGGVALASDVLKTREAN